MKGRKRQKKQVEGSDREEKREDLVNGAAETEGRER